MAAKKSRLKTSLTTSLIEEVQNEPTETEQTTPEVEKPTETEQTTEEVAPPEPIAQPTRAMIATVTLSPTLQGLDEARMPQTTVCMNCMAAMWQVLPNGLRCYCRITNSFSYTTAKPTQLEECDGVEIAAAQAEG